MIDCSRIPLKDKGCHLIAGFVITLIVGFLTSVEYGILAGAIAGVGKEVYDYYDYGTFDNRDLFFTVVGTIIGGLILILMA